MIEQYEVEKIKVIGSNYMAGSGLPIPNAKHAANMADFALALVDQVKQFNREKKGDLQWKIGIAVGSVVAGVIGSAKFTYDVFGDTVNTASRMYSFSPVNEIQMTQVASYFISCTHKTEEHPESPINIKGKGLMRTFLLRSRHQGNKIAATETRLARVEPTQEKSHANSRRSSISEGFRERKESQKPHVLQV